MLGMDLIASAVHALQASFTGFAPRRRDTSSQMRSLPHDAEAGTSPERNAGHRRPVSRTGRMFLITRYSLSSLSVRGMTVTLTGRPTNDSRSSESTPAKVILRPAIALSHFSALALLVLGRRTSPCRILPGRGPWHLTRILYPGYFIVESKQTLRTMAGIDFLGIGSAVSYHIALTTSPRCRSGIR